MCLLENGDEMYERKRMIDTRNREEIKIECQKILKLQR